MVGARNARRHRECSYQAQIARILNHYPPTSRTLLKIFWSSWISPRLVEDQNEALQKFRRAANYIAAAMIFLSDNVYIQRDLTFDDIKPRLLGHCGTCPGLTLVYSHLNVLIEKHDLEVLYVVGPGHVAPSILANLWIEGSLEKFYPECSRDAKGLHSLITGFSATGGFPSHINSGTPRAIHKGK